MVGLDGGVWEEDPEGGALFMPLCRGAGRHQDASPLALALTPGRGRVCQAAPLPWTVPLCLPPPAAFFTRRSLGTARIRG